MSQINARSPSKLPIQPGPESKGNQVCHMSPVAAAILAAIYPTSQSLAQESDSAGRLEEITVTATRREKSIQDLGQSVTAFTTEAIEQTREQAAARG